MLKLSSKQESLSCLSLDAHLFNSRVQIIIVFVDRWAYQGKYKNATLGLAQPSRWAHEP